MSPKVRNVTQTSCLAVEDTSHVKTAHPLRVKAYVNRKQIQMILPQLSTASFNNFNACMLLQLYFIPLFLLRYVLNLYCFSCFNPNLCHNDIILYYYLYLNSHIIGIWEYINSSCISDYCVRWKQDM